MKKKRLATTKSAVALRPANYVELMAGWCDLFEVLFAVTWIFGMVSFYRTMNDERSNRFYSAIMPPPRQMSPE